MKSDEIDNVDDGATCCAHLNVKYEPRRHKHPKYRETLSDAWFCELCGTEFIRKPLVASKIMKSDEILAELLMKSDHCPMEDALHPGDVYPCDDIPQPSSCKYCVLDWARKKAKESEEK